ncbi:DUF3472 domain-containing protein [Mucilaginibacter sabulilitoris]|uniref:DUF3472 domain-containing protein n=1 Tax=Mucilaginibacter sabulilitoris TaxID=1173583 RepID=A0ABZ0TY88_9SPHI|nr:DUF3472 domain-containing protein [Mucilaginibacter sabulilitoris]WPU96085.1 DUF3472 domain-containing protein [Mucilaginibacter sabulilitoris]
MNTRIKKAIGKIFTALAICLLLQLSSHATVIPADSVITVPLGGNAWVSNGAKARIDSAGLVNWSGAADVISVYVRAESEGSLNIDLKLFVPDGSAKIKVTAGETVLTKTISNHKPAIINFGKAIIKATGYVQIKLQGLQKSGKVYANVSDLLLSGSALAKGAVYVKDNHGNYFHWGRRGPSVHLNYRLPVETQDNVEWFYNEVTVPVGNDVIGSYFMADGFNAGYFGMQVNSSTERRVLFSIWSPFETDDPKSIPDSLKINLLKKGEGVHAGEFGGEGSGGQSYMVYPWVAGKTYAFLVHAQADVASKTTILTAYFKPVDQSSWQLIASFKRPKSGLYLKNLYSFLENFEPDMGNVQRKVFFGNGWVADTTGKWYPLTKALFTGDATANINYRKDYGGGVKGDQFFLRNCGFFNDFSLLKVELMRQQSANKHPEINFNKLP